MIQAIFLGGTRGIVLTAALSAAATTLSVSVSDAAKLSATLANGDFLPLWLTQAGADPALETSYEVVKAIAVNQATGVVTLAAARTIEGTNQAWAVGDKCESRYNPRMANDLAANIPKPAASYRVVATPCRIPSIMGGLKQVYQPLLCQAQDDLDSLQLIYSNYGGLTEAIAGAATLSLMVGIEYPVGSDKLQLFTWNRNSIGSIPNGADGGTDVLKFLARIPNQSYFKLFQWASSPTSIPLATNGPSPATFSNTNGFLVQSGTAGTNQNNLQLVATSAARNAPAATDNSSTLYFGPTVMIAPTTKRAFAFIADSRGGGQNFGSPYQYDFADTAAGLAGPCERVFGGQGFGWVNLGIASDSLAIFLGTVVASGGGGRRMNFLNYVTDIVVADGVNGLGAGTTAVLALETTFFNLAALQGKRIWGMTVPPNATASTDFFATAAGQTVGATDATRQALNAQRKTDPRYTGGVLDYSSIVEDPVNPGKWRVGAGARVVPVAMAAGSNVVTGTGFTAADGGFDVVVPGAGTSSPPGGTQVTTATAYLRAMAVYVSPTQLNLVNRITGVAANATTTVAAASAVIQDAVYTGDGIHETQYADKLYQAAFAPVVAAALLAQGSTA